MLARQYNQALVAVERNNHGHAVLGTWRLTYADVLLYHQKGQAGWLTIGGIASAHAGQPGGGAGGGSVPV